jgi:hypothetical protein
MNVARSSGQPSFAHRFRVFKNSLVVTHVKVVERL